MRPSSIRISAVLVSLAVAVSVALAAGSSSKPKTDTRPGVAEYNAGVKLMKKGKYPQAQSKFEEALAKDEKMAVAHNNLGYSLRKQGPEKYTEALRHYDRAVELDPELAEAYMYRGVLHVLLGDETRALEDHRTLAGLDRKLADSLQAVIASGEEPDGLEGLARAW